MSDAFDTAMLILRIATGLVLFAHGVKHALGREKTTNWFASIGFKSPQLQWFASTATELGAGALLALGLITSVAAAALIGIVFVAFWAVHRTAGFFITSFMKPGVDVEGWEYVFTLAVIGFVIAIAGPGSFSIDGAIGIAHDLDSWVGLAIATAGLLAAIGQVILFYRPARVGTGA
ncbi:MAG: DoxX family protein [Acidimicrobiia bacterium]